MPNDASTDTIIIKNAKIIFRNFSGKKAKFNPAGARNFCTLIENPDLVEKLKEEGWNIKPLTRARSHDPDEEPAYFIKVNINYDYKIPPKVFVITGNHKRLLNERNINELDYANFKKVDLAINPHPWTRDDGSEGMSGYLMSMYATIEEDELAADYADFETSEVEPADDYMPF